MAFIESMFKFANGDMSSFHSIYWRTLLLLVLFPRKIPISINFPCILMNMILVDWDSFHLRIIVTLRHYLQNTYFEGNPTVTGGFPSQRASGAELWCFAWTNGWANTRDAGDLKRHCTNYDVTNDWGKWAMFEWMKSRDIWHLTPEY